MLVDNYDSFTWNLYHYFEQLSEAVDVFRNDDEKCFTAAGYDAMVISPGPGLPADAGFTPLLIREFADTLPVLGICLGYQALVEHYGGKLLNLEAVLHGIQLHTTVTYRESVLFRGLPDLLETGHYHSWIADPGCFPEVLKVTAIDSLGHIMAFEHRELPVMGLQFHPESVMTPLGFRMLNNWIAFLQSKLTETV